MADALFAIAVISGSLAYLYADSKLPHLTLSDPVGLRVFPAIIGCGLLLSGAALLIESVKKLKSRTPISAAAPAASHHWLILAGIVVCTALYYAAFEPLGYLLSTIAYVFAMLSYFHHGRWRSNAAIACGFAVFAQVLFSNLLGVSLPSGLLPDF
jgi:putative tricarboxylic transport membrane protein